MSHNLSGPLNANGNEVQNALFHNLGANPSSPLLGRYFVNTSDKFVYYYDGTAFRQLTTLAQILALRLDQFAAPAAAVNINSQRLTNLADAVSAQDAVTLNQLQAAITGLKWKDAVRVLSTTNITLSGTQTIDGISLVAGDRVGVIGQTTGSANGLYVVASGAWTRTLDADASSEVLGMTFFVSEGTTYGNRVYTMTTDAPITLGTTALVFAQLGAGVSYTQGTGISITGSTISLDTTVAARKVVFQIGNGSSTSIALTHNLNTKAVTVGLRKVSTDEHWIPDVTSTSVNSVTLSFSTAPASNEFEAVVIG